MESKEKSSGEVIIPFNYRKSLLLSISFRALNLEMSEYKMKVESVFEDEPIEPLITGLCELTMVNKFNKFFFRSQNSK